MASVLALSARLQCVHTLVSSGLHVEVCWFTHAAAGEEQWHEVAGSKSAEDHVALELVVRSNLRRSVQVMLQKDHVLMQVVDHSNAEWVEAHAVAACVVRAKDAAAEDGPVLAQLFF